MTSLDPVGTRPDGDAVLTGDPAGAAAAAPAAPVPIPVGVPIGARREALYFAFRNRKLLVGLAIIVLLLALAIVGPMFSDAGPNEFVGPAAAPPSAEWWFGTTTFGQDIFAQFTHGLRATFLVGVMGGVIAAVVGMLVGFTAGYRGGITDEILNMLTNIVIVIPTLAVLVVVHAYLGVRSVGMQALFIGLTSWPWVARAVRAQTFSLRTRDFVDLARLSGARAWKIVLREIAPNMSSYLLMVFILLFGGSVLIAAGLDFIGLGPSTGISLGLILNHSTRWGAMQLGMWWWFVPPGLGITAIVGSFYVMNVGLDEVFNPKLREM